MKDFIEHVQKSIYGPEYYRAITVRPTSYSWKYYGSLALFLAVLMTIVTSLPLIPRLNTFLERLPEKVATYFPEELRIDIDDGRVTTNVTEPYFIDFPGSPSLQATSSPLLRIAVVDTRADITLDQFRAYNVAFWLSRDSAIALDGEEKLRIAPLKGLTAVIDAQHIRAAMNELRPYFVVLTPLLVILIFLGMLLSFVAMLGYLLFDALLVFLLGKVMKYSWSYSDAYHISLHAVTLPVLLSSVFYLLPVSGLQLPFFSTALLLLVVYVNFRGDTPVLTELNKEG
jgi:hypothetical protein